MLIIPLGEGIMWEGIIMASQRHCIHDEFTVETIGEGARTRSHYQEDYK